MNKVMKSEILFQIGFKSAINFMNGIQYNFPVI